ncbi:MAG: ABC transporter permease [Ignavibacteriae bacterium]|nr:ABC transporter permease [Ignavibacteriota bacterium]
MSVFRMIFKNTLRHPLRNFLTMLGIAVAVSAFGLLRTVLTSWDAAIEVAAVDRLVTRDAVSFIFPMPLAYAEKIEKVKGIETLCFFNWFQGVYKDKQNFFPRMAVQPDRVFSVYPEYILSPTELEAFEKERKACVIGESIAQQFNLKLGDQMTIEGDIYPGNWDFIIRGIYKRRDEKVDGTQMFFHWDYLNERMNQVAPGRANQIGWIVAKLSPGANPAAVADEIDNQFKNSSTETKSETERSFNQSFFESYSAIFTAIRIVSVLIIGIILLVLGNTMIMSTRERTQEYAMLKTLGFSGQNLISFIAGESILLSFIGAMIGIVLLYLLVQVVSAVVPKQFFPVFFIAPSTYIITFSAAVALGFLAALQPVMTTLKTRIVDGLRFIG